MNLSEPDKKIMSLVKLHPSIYDRTALGYGDNNSRSEIWENIGRACGSDGSKVRLRYKSIREKVTRILRESSDGRFPYSAELFDFHWLVAHITIERGKRRRQPALLPGQVPENNNGGIQPDDPNVRVVNPLNINENDRKMMSMVKEHRVLYDKTVPGYHNQPNRHDLWRKIGEACEMEDTVARARYKGIREKVGKRYRESKQEGAMSFDPELINFDWLLPHILPRPGRRLSCGWVSQPRTPKPPKRITPEALGNIPMVEPKKKREALDLLVENPVSDLEDQALWDGLLPYFKRVPQEKKLMAHGYIMSYLQKVILPDR